MPAVVEDAEASSPQVQSYPSEGSRDTHPSEAKTTDYSTSECKSSQKTLSEVKQPILRRSSREGASLRPGVTAEMNTIHSVLPSAAWQSDGPDSPRSRRSDNDDHREERYLRRVISSTRFNLLVGAMILLNTFLMGLELDQNEAAGPDDAMLATLSPQNIPQQFFDGFEVLFFIVFVLEFLARLVVYRLPLFCEVSTYIDILALSPIVLLFGFNMKDTRQLTLIRVVRLVKLCRLLRLFRLSKELNMLAHSMASASRALLWIGLLLLITVYCAAIACTMVIGHNSNFHPDNPSVVYYHEMYEETVYTKRYWGSMTRSMLTLFQIFTLDDWNQIVRPVVETHQPWMLLFFICFVFITTFGLLNLLMGTIVDRAISIAKEQEEEKDKLLSNENKQVMLATVRIFSLIDEDSNGRISAREIRDFLEHNDLQKVLEKEMSRFKIKIDYSGLMDICLKIAEEWMDACGPDADGITVQEFAGACSRLQGPAKSQDLFSVLVATKSTQSRVETVEGRLERMEKRLELLSQLHESKFDMLMDMLAHRNEPMQRVATDSEISTVSSSKEITKCNAKEGLTFTPPEVPGQPDGALPLRVTAKSTRDGILGGVEEAESAEELCNLSELACQSASSSNALKRQPTSLSIGTIKSSPAENVHHDTPMQGRRMSSSERAQDGGGGGGGGLTGGLSELLGQRDSLARSGSQRINSLTTELSSFGDLACTETAARMRRYSDVGWMAGGIPGMANHGRRSSNTNDNGGGRRQSRTLSRHFDRSQSKSEENREEMRVLDNEPSPDQKKSSMRGNNRTKSEFIQKRVMSPVHVKEFSPVQSVGSKDFR